MGVLRYAKNLASFIPQNSNSSMGPSLIGAAGSVIGGALGFLGQQSANKTNLKIARETNAANRANQEYQNEWNLEMWNKQNEYNSPAAMRQRLEAAGLNPIMTGLDGVSQADQLQSADYVATPGAPMLNSGEFLGNGISNAMKTMAEIKLLDAQAKKTDADRGLTDVEKRIRESMSTGLIEMQGVEIKLKKSQISLTDEQVKNAAANTEYISQLQQESIAKVEQMGKDYDLKKLQYELDKWYKEVEIRIKESGLTLEQQRLEFEKAKFQQEIAVAWYNSYTQRKEVVLHAEHTQWMKRKTSAEVKFINGKISMQGLEAKEIGQRILTGASTAYKNYFDTKAGTGLLGDILRFSNGVTDLITGDDVLQNSVNRDFKYN